MSIEPVSGLFESVMNYYGTEEAAGELRSAADKAQATTEKYSDLASAQYAPYAAKGKEYLTRLDDMIKSGSYTWTKDPATNLAWTWDGVKAMKIGVRLNCSNVSAEPRCSWLYATINSTDAPAAGVPSQAIWFS